MSARQTGKLRPTGELNQLNQCYWARAASWDHLYIPCDPDRSYILPAPEGKVQEDFWHCELGGHGDNDYLPRQRQGLPGTLVGGGDRGVKGRGL